MDSDEQARSLIGAIVADKYCVLDVLGSGGMGTVYMAEHVFTKRRVALKRMHPELGRSKQAAERFIRESQAPCTIGHPGIVQVLDGGSQSDGSLYIVHELLEGVSMSEALERNALTASAVVQLGIELLQALAAAHEKGIIHRDIKPDNVFIAQDGRGGVSIKLLDFGIASLRDTSLNDKLTRPGSVLGTAHYMSPEQATAAPIDERSDLWSVGALLYHALCGLLPYPGATFSAVIYALASKQHVPLAVHRPDLPKPLVEVVERALRKPADERFTSAAEMCAQLAAVSFDEAEPAANSKPLPDPMGEAATTRVGSVQRPPAAVRAAQVQHSHPAAVAISRAPGKPTSASVKLSVLAAGVLLCALIWIGLRERSHETRAAMGQLGTTDSVVAPPAEPVRRERALIAEQASASAPLAAAAPQGLPMSALAPVLASRQAQLERCLQESVVSQLLAAAESVKAYRLDVSMSVAVSGKVERVELSGAAPAELLGCLRAELLTAAFPRAEAPTTFDYPLVLTPTVLGQADR